MAAIRNEHTGYVLITGAAGGIGLNLAGEFAQGGWDLVLVDMNPENLKAGAAALREKYNIKVREFVSDLTAPEAPEKLWQEVKASGLEIGALVNNAGFGILGKFHENPLEGYLKMIELHVRVVTKLTWLFLKERTGAKKPGRLLNVVSIGGFMACPLFSIYHATKSYVLLFSEALANELEGSGIDVTILCPGTVRTGFQKTANNEHVKAAQKGLMGPEEVARAAYKGFVRKKRIIIPGFKNKLIVFLTRLLPRKMTGSIMRSYYEE